jgi:diguanylate cyclase (GGDEF)-like protein
MLFVAVLGSVGAAFMIGMLWEQRRRLVEMAMTDPLTGAYNRRHLDTCLTATIARRNRTGEPASLLYFDVDHFKRINDALGHGAGDEVLKALVALVSGRARKMDVLFRIGGEEFVLLLPGARYAGAFLVAEQLRALVAEADLLCGWRVSISIGVSELQAGQSAANWIEDADAGAFRAKQSGRNRVGMPGRMTLAPAARAARC